MKSNLKIITDESVLEPIKSPFVLLEEIKELEDIITANENKVTELKKKLQMFLSVTNCIESKLGKVSMITRHTYKSIDLDTVDAGYVIIEKKLNTTKIKAYKELTQTLPKGVDESVTEYMSIRWNKNEE